LPEGFDHHYNAADMRCWLGEALLGNQKAQEAQKVLEQAVAVDPSHARSQYLLAFSLAAQGLTREPAEHYHVACASQPGVDTIPEFHFLMSVNYEKAGDPRQAFVCAQKGLELVRTLGHHQQEQVFEERLKQCRKAAEGF
jgi:TolA-binding protein